MKNIINFFNSERRHQNSKSASPLSALNIPSFGLWIKLIRIKNNLPNRVHAKINMKYDAYDLIHDVIAACDQYHGFGHSANECIYCKQSVINDYVYMCTNCTEQVVTGNYSIPAFWINKLHDRLRV